MKPININIKSILGTLVTIGGDLDAETIGQQIADALVKAVESAEILSDCEVNYGRPTVSSKNNRSRMDIIWDDIERLSIELNEKLDIAVKEGYEISAKIALYQRSSRAMKSPMILIEITDNRV